MVHRFGSRPLPSELQPLADFALDLRLSGSQITELIWQTLDPEAWDRVKNPFMILQHVHQNRLDALASNEELRARLAERVERRDRYMAHPGWFGAHHAASELKGVAYFSMEFGLSEALPIYSGGLGILAGDHLKSASDLNVPIYGIGLLYQQGYFRQVLADDGSQLEAFPFNDPGTLPVLPVLDQDGRWPRVRLELPGRTLFLRVWRAQVGKISLYLLDSNHPLNNPWDRGITANLYAAGKEKRLLQELVLGVGGWRLLEKLGHEVQVCHLNEGHAAFAVLARAANFAETRGVSFEVALRTTRAGNVFTTHTPVEAAFDQFEPALLAKYAVPFIETTGTTMDRVLAMGRRDPANDSERFNMAYLAMRGCGQVNGVARLHGRVSKSLFRTIFPGWPEKEVPVGYVTNGVHVPSWDSVPANQLWKSVYDGDGTWLDNLDQAEKALARITDEQLWDFRAASRKLLVDYVRRRLERQLRERGASEKEVHDARHVLDPNYLTLGFARCFTAYKRPNLLLHDAERFAEFLKYQDRPAQMIVAGKAHPNDDAGKGMVRAMAQFAQRADLRDRFVFLEDYEISLAQHLVAGVDVWINNPRRPAEACGTSGMKTLANGGIHFSTLDGWWDEAFTPDVGFQVGGGREHKGELDIDEVSEMYDVLEEQVAAEFYDRDDVGVPRRWVQRVRASMSQLTSQFSSDRMVREYVEQAYLPAAEAFLRRAADGARLGWQVQEWHEMLDEEWAGLRYGDLHVKRTDDGWRFEIQAYLSGLTPDSVTMQLYRDGSESGHDELPEIIEMQREGPVPGAVNGFLFTASVATDRPPEHFTPRIVPYHPDAVVPLEAVHVKWYR